MAREIEPHESSPSVKRLQRMDLGPPIESDTDETVTLTQTELDALVEAKAIELIARQNYERELDAQAARASYTGSYNTPQRRGPTPITFATGNTLHATGIPLSPNRLPITPRPIHPFDSPQSRESGRVYLSAGLARRASGRTPRSTRSKSFSPSASSPLTKRDARSVGRDEETDATSPKKQRVVMSEPVSGATDGEEDMEEDQDWDKALEEVDQRISVYSERLREIEEGGDERLGETVDGLREAVRSLQNVRDGMVRKMGKMGKKKQTVGSFDAEGTGGSTG